VLLERGCDPNCTDRDTDQTPLMHACRGHHVACVELILQTRGIDTQAVDRVLGLTALEFAREDCDTPEFRSSSGLDRKMGLGLIEELFNKRLRKPTKSAGQIHRSSHQNF
jgi:hypothetical protein